MTEMETTSWGLVEAAGKGDAPSLAAFARRYQGLVRSVLSGRWRGSAWLLDLDDAVQDVFVECVRGGGALQRADRTRGPQFRAFLAGVVRNVALRYESARHLRHGHGSLPTDDQPSRDDPVSHQLDRAWMHMLLRQAGERFRSACAADGPTGLRRWEILRLRFEAGLPIRSIAAQLGGPVEALHTEYRRVRRQFRACIEEELALHSEGPDDVKRLWRELHDLL